MKSNNDAPVALRDDEEVVLVGAANVESIGLTTNDQIEARRYEKALDDFCEETRTRFDGRFPGIGYNSDAWNFKGTQYVADKRISLRQVHNTRLTRIAPLVVVNELSGLHSSFARAARAVLANGALRNETKGLESLRYGLQLLKLIPPASVCQDSIQLPIGTLSLESLRSLEKSVVNLAKSSGQSAERLRNNLHGLFLAVEMLQSHGVVSRMNARMSHDVRDELGRIARDQSKASKDRKAAELEPSIAALSDAIVEMVDDNPLLSMIHKASLCVMGLEMCAPSRINEILTLSMNDRIVSSAAYDDQPQGGEGGDAKSDEAIKLRRHLHRAHSEMKSTPDVVITMKGSKGAAWGPKPILDFMTDLFNECFDRLIEYGKRSRELVRHYEQYPKKLYLPQSLEHLRGKALDRRQVGQIMLQDPAASDLKSRSCSRYVMEALTDAKKIFRRDCAPDTVFATGSQTTWSNGQTAQVDERTLYCHWRDLEAELLRRVNEAMESIRWVTRGVRYEGKLSNMLLLHDGVGMTPPYLPSALSDSDVRRYLKPLKNGRGTPARTVFELLNIKMPLRVVDKRGSRGASAQHKVVIAYVSPHDPRRWLTTQALRLAGPELSRLVVNKWANRKDLGQVDRYDCASTEEKARRSAAPVPEAMNEMEGFSGALSAVSSSRNGLHSEYGLRTRLLSSGTRTVETTTLSEIRDAVENRPVAKAGGKVIILYPTRYGVCLHQHHERACTAFNGCGTACNEQTFVKGDLPSNEATRREAEHLHAIVVGQIRPLVLAHARGVAHDPTSLEEHIMALITPHMSVEDIATRLIEEFHDYRDVITDAAFRARLEDAHVFHGVARMLDDPKVAPGALIRYDNPTRHGVPEFERSIEALGGRSTIAQTIANFNMSRPWFAPVPMNSDELARLRETREEAANDCEREGDRGEGEEPER